VAERAPGETGVLGDAVNVAARLQEEARPDEVLISETVWRRVRHRFGAEPVGLLQVKGREGPVEAYAVTGPEAGPPRRHAPFVGRRDERALLELLWSSAEKRNTHVVTLVGEPGVGKSRLLAELPRREEAFDVRVTCDGERPFGPFADLIAAMLGGMPASVEELEAGAVQLGVAAGAAGPLGALLGLAEAADGSEAGSEQRRQRLFQAVARFLEEASGRRPVLAVMDDVHWADGSTADLLDFLLSRLSGVAVMMILASRPGGTRQEPAALRASHTVIRLEALSAEESLDLVRGYLEVEHLPPDLREVIASRTEGNPFYIEELLQTLQELGSLTVTEGKAALQGAVVDVPDTVQGTILSRIDRLGAEERTVLQPAAVIGRSFTADLLARVAGVGDPAPALAALARSQLLVSEGSGRWRFKHALIQEVVYQTLLHRQRRDLHRAAAEALEASAGDDPDLLGVLAEHFSRAEAPEEARRYAVRAGDLAAERLGFTEAARRYQAALRLWGEGDREGRLSLLVALGRAALLGGDPAAARTALVEAEAGWRDMGNLDRAGAALAILGRVHYVSGETARAREVLHSAISVLEPFGPSSDLVRAFMVLASIEMVSGNIDRATEEAGRGLELAEALGLDAARSQLLNTLGSCAVFAGDPSGVERLEEAMELAHRSEDAEALGRVYVNLPYALSELYRNREGIEMCIRGREELRRLGTPTFEWFVAGNQATMLVELGEYGAAESLCREMLSEHRRSLDVPGIVNAFGPLITLRLRTGRLDEARTALDEAMPMAQRVGGAEFLSWMLTLEGELEMARGNRAAAGQALEQALDIVVPTPSVGHLLHVLVPSAMAGASRTGEVLERCRAASRHPAHECRILEAEGWLSGDPEAFARAAEVYASLELPFQEARSWLGAGREDRAEPLIQRFGLAASALRSSAGATSR
ncbi:MAG TPA: AAA family ATPase, partial [Actinomycetota bacterium]